MLKTIRTSLFCLIVLCGSALLNAQDIKEFSSDPLELGTQLDQLFGKYLSRSETKKALDNFKENLSTPPTFERAADFAALFDLMRSKKMKVVPYYENVLLAYNELLALESSQEGKMFRSWYKTTTAFAEKQKPLKTNSFKKYLEFSYQLFQKGALYESSAKSWIADSQVYEFFYEDNIPKVKIDETNLKTITKKDSTYIFKTSGIYTPSTNEWKGKGGEISWKNSEELYYEDASATFEDYVIDMKSTNYEIKDVKFNLKDLFTNPLKGVLSNKIESGSKENKSYPRFKSNKTDLKIEGIDPKVAFRGGFGLNGQKIIIFGGENGVAKMQVRNDEGKVMFSSSAPVFGVREREKISSVDTEVALYFKNDSIFHPSLDLAYSISTQDLRVARNEKTISQGPFVSSYHKIETEIDAVSWNLQDTIMTLTQSTQVKSRPLYVDSYDFYNPKLLQKYRKAISKDPIVILGNWYGSTMSDQMPAQDFASQLGGNYKVSDALNVIYDLVNDGFAFYDPQNEMIHIRPKANLYAQAQFGKMDYDKITLKSVSQRENLSLNLNTSDLSAIGVEKVILSDSQRVVLFPYDKIININENRNIKAYGDLVAGQMDFVGGNYSLDYNNFTVKVDSVKKMFFYVKDEEQFQDKVVTKAKKVSTPINDVVGTLYIDAPDNKSGKENIDGYPRFKTDGASFIYYDNDELFGGAYERERFYFQLDAFEFEDVNVIPKEKFQFRGTMVYGDIFPELRVSAGLQENLTLDVNADITGEDYQMYKGIGMYNGSVNLSENGLRGNGTVQFMTTTVKGEDFIFFPDSTITDKVYSVIVEKGEKNGVPYPDVLNSGINFKWFPYRDSMMLYGAQKPYSIFEGRSQFRGRLTMTGKGMFSKGEMSWKDTKIKSNRFSYNETCFLADSLHIEVEDKNDKLILRSLEAMKANVDVYKELGVFEPGKWEQLEVKLPKHRLLASLDRMEIDYKQGKIKLKNNTDSENYFISLNPQQKGLKFRSEEGAIDLATQEIEFNGVKEIVVADARIIPENNTMKMIMDAEISTMENATIIIDTIKEYHLITDATVDVFTKNEFKASGTYKYQSKYLDKDQDIYFSEIESRTEGFVDEEEAQMLKENTEIKEGKGKNKKDKKKKAPKEKKAKPDKKKKNFEEEFGELANETTPSDTMANLSLEEELANLKIESDDKVFRTYSKARIAAEDNFKLDPKTDFKGRVFLDSQDRFLTFDGFARINLNTQYMKPEWFKFREKINPDNLQVDLSSPIGEYKDSLYVGTFFSFEDLRPYSSFINSKKTSADFGMISAKGLLDYNPEKEIYRIGDPEKVEGKKLQGNVMAFKDTKEQIVITEGKICLLQNLGFVIADAGGQIKNNLVDSSFAINEMVLGLDFMIDEKAFEEMTTDLKELIAENKEINYLTTGFSRGLVEILPDNMINQATVALAQNGYFKRPEKGFDYKLFLANLNLIWDEENASFRSIGSFGLGYMGETYVNREVTGYVEFAPRKKGDYFHIYINEKDVETSQNEWYYFYYRSGFMQMLSSNANFNKMISKVKGKKRKKVSKDKLTSYQYALASTVTVNNFVMRMQEAAKNDPKPEKKKKRGGK